jgi:hypothetical protein
MRIRVGLREIPATTAKNSGFVSLPELGHGVSCPNCHRRRLELSQPDLSRPDRLLGICPRCHCWSVIEEGDEGRSRITLMSEPDRA